MDAQMTLDIETEPKKEPDLFDGACCKATVKHKLGKRAFEIKFCDRPAVVVIEGVFYCGKHAGHPSWD